MSTLSMDQRCDNNNHQIFKVPLSSHKVLLGTLCKCKRKNPYFILYFFVTRSVNQSLHFSVIVPHLSNQIQIYSEIHHTNINTHNCRWVTAVLFIDYKLIPLICFLFSISMYLFVNVVLCVLFWFLCLESPPLSCDLCWSWLYSPVSCSALD